MTTSITDNKKPRGRPRTGVGTLVGVRMSPDELALLDRFIAEMKPDLSRPEALRFAFRDWAIGQGLAPHREDPEGAN
ncbi:hypothetical protein B5U98_24000 [Bosea sp. Tri-39]|nr:hypothetical protein B5U98_24000 [Bosea sp. Tri-39]RXT32919.1 hypothetical protein B5U99_30345 [Bosea sp. Tri-54]